MSLAPPAMTASHYYTFIVDAFAKFDLEARLFVPTPTDLAVGRKPSAKLLQHCATLAGKHGAVLEFGVWKGISIRILAEALPEHLVYGFDSFEGFPNDGRVDCWDFDFAVASLPEVPRNVELVKGFFADTLPGFAQRLHSHGEAVSLLHIDCDIYSSTLEVLFSLSPLIEPGCLIMFDELINHDRFIENEMLALYEFLEYRELSFQWIGALSRPMDLARFIALERNGAIPRTMAEFRELGLFQAAAIRLIPAPSFNSYEQMKLRTSSDKLFADRPIRQPLSKLSTNDHVAR